jgi:hypothetical protein
MSSTSSTGHSRLIWRTAADALIGLVLFAMFATAVGAYQRAAVANRLDDLLAVSSSAGDLFRFSPDAGPLLAAAVVATAVPVQHHSVEHHIRNLHSLHRSSHHAAYALLAGIFSALVAFNLAFLRHLRREYASPR